MNYGELVSAFGKTLDNRRVTTDQLKDWLQLAITRAQRLLEIPASETVVQVTIAEAGGTLSIPQDCIKLIAVTYNGVDLHEERPSSVRPLSNVPGYPRIFAQVGGALFIGPAPNIGDVIEITYRSDFSTLVNDTDTNWLSNYAPQLLIDGAMVLACRYLNADPRGPDYEAVFTQTITDMNAEADRDRFRNAVISPGWYTGDCW